MKTKDFVSIERRLVSVLPGFAIKGALMLMTPLEHTLKGLSFEGSSFDKESFYVWRFFLPLCVPQQYLTFTLGDRLLDRGGDRWNITEPNWEPRLIAAIQEQALPALTPLRRARDVAEAAEAQARVSRHPSAYQAAAYMFARAGEIGRSLVVLDDFLAVLPTERPWQREMAARALLLQAKLREDPPSAESQLLAWEAESLRNLGLERFSMHPEVA